LKVPGHSLFISFLLLMACVDRISLDTGITYYPVVVEGFISDKPGPYEIRVTRSFDVQSKSAIKTNISAKRIAIFDDSGYSEDLTEIRQGVYQTSPSGIQGQIGKAYKLKVELLDGRVYESIPDTLYETGTVDSVYFSFFQEKASDLTTHYGFDVAFDASSGGDHGDNILWKFTGTYQIETNPELRDEPCGESRCPRPPPCSGWTANGSVLEQVGACECCTCWVDFQNEVPLVSDNLGVQGGQYRNVKAYRVPLTQWIFMSKVYVRIDQMRLSGRAFAFWRSIKAQKEASGSLFQPITGLVPNNYIQTSGEPGKLEGFFFAGAIHSNGVFITRNDVPNQLLIPSQDLPFKESCLMFPNSTNQKPDFWQ
jgi:hypothetical protein